MKPRLPIVILSITLILTIFSLKMGPLWLLNATEPFHASLNSALQSISSFGGFFTDVKKLSAERDSLASERNQLLAKVASLQAQISENQAWQKQLANSTFAPSQLTAATTAGLVNRGSSYYLLINKGSRDKVKAGQVVLSDGVLVGRVKLVDTQVSLVQLPISQDSAIPVIVKSGESTAKGIVEGQFNLSAQLDQVLPTEKINPGDIIVTSGEAATYPPNLVVGRVGQLNPDRQIFQSATVSLPWDMARLSTVFVVTS